MKFIHVKQFVLYIIYIIYIDYGLTLKIINQNNLNINPTFSNLKVKSNIFQNNLKYSIPALITPMNTDYSIDYDKFEQLIYYHLDKSDALTILGSTGEWSSIKCKERKNLIKKASQIINGQFPLIVGSGDLDTYKTILNCRNAEKYGADINLIISPFYTRPTQEGILENYQYITDQTSLPILIYDCPSRTSIELSESIIETLSFDPQIIGIKDATGNISKLSNLKKKCHSDFVFFSGDDKSSFDFCQTGGNGCITVVGNLIPQLYRLIIQQSDKDIEKSLNHFEKIIPLIDALSCQSNPIPIKYAVYQYMYQQGYWMDKEYEMRLPLKKLPLEYQKIIDQHLLSINDYY